MLIGFIYLQYIENDQTASESLQYMSPPWNSECGHIDGFAVFATALRADPRCPRAPYESRHHKIWTRASYIENDKFGKVTYISIYCKRKCW